MDLEVADFHSVSCKVNVVFELNVVHKVTRGNANLSVYHTECCYLLKLQSFFLIQYQELQTETAQRIYIDKEHK